MARITKKRALAVAGTLAVAGLALSACSGGGSEGESGDTLKLWHYEGEDSAMAKAWTEAIKIFEEETGATVEFEQKSFEQIQKTASQVLDSDAAPDLMEFNKGNATAGFLASTGLIADISDAVDEYGWADKLAPSLQTTAKYSEDGVMGGDTWYGIPNYGEFVGVYYNEDAFAAAGLEIPTTYDEFLDVLDAFVAQGITPARRGRRRVPARPALVPARAARRPTASSSTTTSSTRTPSTGRVRSSPTRPRRSRSTSTRATSPRTSRRSRPRTRVSRSSTAPPRSSCRARGGSDASSSRPASTGRSRPSRTRELSLGSSGNLWVVPENAANKELAYEFIDITMRPEIQAIIGNNGGVPVAADPADITDAKSQELIATFNGVLDNDGLSFYPDWPAAGFYDVIVRELQGLVTGTQDAETTNANLGAEYEEGTADFR